MLCTQSSSSGSSRANVSPVSGSWPRSRACSRRTRAAAASTSAVERERADPDELDGALEPGPGLGRVEQRRVLVGPAHHPRVQRLQQQRPEPADPQHRLEVHPPGHRPGTEQPVIRRCHGHLPRRPSTPPRAAIREPSPRRHGARATSRHDPRPVRLHDRLDGGDRGRPQRGPPVGRQLGDPLAAVRLVVAVVDEVRGPVQPDVGGVLDGPRRNEPGRPGRVGHRLGRAQPRRPDVP